MQEIVLHKEPIFNTYIRAIDTETPLDTLTLFLTIDCLNSVDYYITWLKSTVCIDGFTGGNVCTMTFDGKNIIIDADSNPTPEDHSQAFITTKEKMINILEKWNHFLQTDSLIEKIDVTLDKDGNVDMLIHDCSRHKKTHDHIL